MLRLAVAREHPPDWDAYRSVSIAFEVATAIRVTPDARAEGGAALTEAPVCEPYVKDYDALEGGVARWSAFYTPDRWGVYVARIDGERVGGAVVSLEPTITAEAVGPARKACAYLWDIRVATRWRGAGVGHELFRAAESWARDHSCDVLLIETQNVNVAACRFYQRQGCTLIHVDAHAYPSLPDEMQLVWMKQLGSS